tara:strand:- start:940 stop:1200 length:261 start_codon:yes stop_codon:yes gene_type:complete
MINYLIKSILLIISIIFFYNTIDFYKSDKNIENIQDKRKNFNNMSYITDVDLPLLKNDTYDVIQFNSGFEEEKFEKKRFFWRLFDK